MTTTYQNKLLMQVKKLRKLWRMPLHKNYDKLMNSKNADMQNINYVGGVAQQRQLNFTKIYFK